MEGESNPYQVPKARLEPTWDHANHPAGTHASVWREGEHVVAKVDAELPARCVKCGDKALSFHKRQVFYWHTPWLFLLLLINLLVYCLVAVFVRKASRHRVGLCAEHAQRRRRFIWMAWAFIPLLIGGLASNEGGIIALCLIVGFGLLIAGVIGARTLTPVRIDAERARYKGAGKDFLAALPTRPDSRR